MSLVTRMAALQAEQRRKTQWHFSSVMLPENAHLTFIEPPLPQGGVASHCEFHRCCASGSTASTSTLSTSTSTNTSTRFGEDVWNDEGSVAGEMVQYVDPI
jgi:hypothetical protein